jgi:hypothetical protein
MTNPAAAPRRGSFMIPRRSRRDLLSPSPRGRRARRRVPGDMTEAGAARASCTARSAAQNYRIDCRVFSREMSLGADASCAMNGPLKSRGPACSSFLHRVSSVEPGARCVDIACLHRRPVLWRHRLWCSTRRLPEGLALARPATASSRHGLREADRRRPCRPLGVEIVHDYAETSCSPADSDLPAGTRTCVELQRGRVPNTTSPSCVRRCA